MFKPVRLALALAAIFCASSVHAQSTIEAPSGSGQRFQGVMLINPSTGQPYVASGGTGGGGGSAADQTASSGSDGQTSRADNQHAVVYNYLFNGSTWDRLRGTGGAANVSVTNFPSIQTVNGTVTVNQGTAAALANAWPTYLIQGGATLSASNPLPISEADGANAALGAKADAAAGTGSASIIALLKQAHLDLLAPTPAGTNAIGSITNTSFGISGTLPAFAATPTFKIDQTTPGTTNGVQINNQSTQTTAGAMEPATAASGKIAVTSTALAANTNTTIAAANASRIAYGIQCGGAAAVNVSETGATLASATFGAAGVSITIPAGSTPPYFSPPIATRTAITAYTGTAQTCVVTEYNR